MKGIPQSRRFAKQVREKAQDELMEGLANAVLMARERGDNPAVIQEMLKQAARIGRLFGYESWSGLGQFSNE
jgi:hypothetical protein